MHVLEVLGVQVDAVLGVLFPAKLAQLVVKFVLHHVIFLHSEDQLLLIVPRLLEILWVELLSHRLVGPGVIKRAAGEIERLLVGIIRLLVLLSYDRLCFSFLLQHLPLEFFAYVLLLLLQHGPSLLQLVENVVLSLAFDAHSLLSFLFKQLHLLV